MNPDVSSGTTQASHNRGGGGDFSARGRGGVRDHCGPAALGLSDRHRCLAQLCSQESHLPESTPEDGGGGAEDFIPRHAKFARGLPHSFGKFQEIAKKNRNIFFRKNSKPKAKGFQNRTRRESENYESRGGDRKSCN